MLQISPVNLNGPHSRLQNFIFELHVGLDERQKNTGASFKCLDQIGNQPSQVRVVTVHLIGN